MRGGGGGGGLFFTLLLFRAKLGSVSAKKLFAQADESDNSSPQATVYKFSERNIQKQQKKAVLKSFSGGGRENSFHKYPQVMCSWVHFSLVQDNKRDDGK